MFKVVCECVVKFSIWERNRCQVLTGFADLGVLLNTYT